MLLFGSEPRRVDLLCQSENFCKTKGIFMTGNIRPLSEGRYSPISITDIEEAEWIRCSDNLPTETGFYMTYDRTSNPNERILFWDGREWVSPHGSRITILAWQELEESVTFESEEGASPCEICGPPARSRTPPFP